MNQQLLDFEPRHSDVDPRDKPRLAGLNVKILEELRQGKRTNLQLTRICLRYGARLHDLRKAGFKIVSRRLHDGVWEFELIEE